MTEANSEGSTQPAIGRVLVRLARQVEISLAKVELTQAQYRILVQLSEGTDASSSLAEKLAVSPPSITTVVDGLVQRGLVERTHSTDDRRRIALTLTKIGRQTLKGADEALAGRFLEIAGTLGEPRTEEALGSLSIWWLALDANRNRRIAERAEKAVAR